MEKTKKPFYKKVWFWLLVVVLIAIAGAGGSSNTNTSSKTASKSDRSSASTKSTDTEQTTKPEKRSSSEKETTSAIKALNDWYKNKYNDEVSSEYEAEGQDYFGTSEYIKAMVFKGFTIENGELTAIIDNQQLKAENFTQKEIANYAFNVVLPSYTGNLPKFENTNSDGSLKDEVMQNPERYSTLK